jgi:molecular chaperone HscB
MDLLRQRYLSRSKEFHPDFFAQQGEEAQQEALRWTAYNNEAFQVLSNRDRRFQYLLGLLGHWEEGERSSLPQSFLMEMMDLNEAIMELRMSRDQAAQMELIKTVQELEKEAFEAILPDLQAYSPSEPQAEILEKVKLFEKKVQYFLRIQENIRNIAYA